MWYCCVVTQVPLASHHERSPTALSTERSTGRAFCISSNNSGNASAKTWLRQATTEQVSGSSAHRQHGASFSSLALQGLLLVLTVWLLAKQTMFSICGESGVPRREEFQTSSRGPRIPFLCQATCPSEGPSLFFHWGCQPTGMCPT